MKKIGMTCLSTAELNLVNEDITSVAMLLIKTRELLSLRKRSASRCPGSDTTS